MIWDERVLDGLLAARRQIDAKSIGKRNHVAPGVTIPFAILSRQLLDAGNRHGHHALLFTLLELDGPVECTLECRLEIEFNRRRFAFGALWVAALPRFELIFFGRMAGTDLVLLLGRFCRGRSTIGAAIVG